MFDNTMSVPNNGTSTAIHTVSDANNAVSVCINRMSVTNNSMSDAKNGMSMFDNGLLLAENKGLAGDIEHSQYTGGLTNSLCKSFSSNHNFSSKFFNHVKETK